jgi:uncharacterized phage infection (PIP) family protein YhgE
MIAIAFPGFPNNDTKVYTIEIGKSGLFYTLGIIQALIVSIGDMVILKAQVESVVWVVQGR